MSNDFDSVIATLCELIRIPSVNPMDRAARGSEHCEARLTDWLQDRFETLGLPWQRQAVSPRRDNIYARLDGDRSPTEGGQVIVFEVHQDTVPVDGMTIAPWTPVHDGDRIYGRGAADVKGGMACMLTALARLQRQRPRSMPTIIMACSVNEENGFTGAYAMAEAWQRDELSILPRLPDAVIVAEPTLLDVVVAHKGLVRWRCTSRGRAAHSSCPQDGDNAIYCMARALEALEEYATKLAAGNSHPMLGPPTLSVGTIRGGLSVNTVPDRCVIEIDRRLLPDETPADARQHAIDWLAARVPHPDRLEHAAPFLAAEGLDQDDNSRLAAALSAAVRARGFRGRHIGVPYATDAHAFARIHIPTVVFGPGSTAQAHTTDEWISVQQLEAAVAILVDFAERMGADSN